MMYRNYGDVNPFQVGRLVDSDHSDTEFRIICNDPYCDLNENGEVHYRYGEVTVDVEDYKDRLKDVCSICGQTPDFYSENPIWFAIDLIDCGYVYVEWEDLEYDEVVERLDNHVIATDGTDMSWSRKRSA